ncbi:A disintegrin and metalloproteinase with thrombospondin motifs 13-like isoform X2 [Dreissena polymorpha]|nr:A disintegrin and metalloproteinase with thrombospondin motifs 13-like isoform X2 [Dreissena polymorpha]
MNLALLLFAAILQWTTTGGHSNKYSFHKELTDDERKFYFGTNDIEEVPNYEYTTPQPIDSRKKRSDVNHDVDVSYVIDVFGKATHIILERNRHLINPGCIVQLVKENVTTVSVCDSEQTNCFYTGRISNDSNSWVAASICGGLHAMIGSSDKTVVVQPIRASHVTRTRRDTLTSQPHIVYEYTARKVLFATDDYVQNTVINKSSRRRRDAGKKIVETTVVVDPTAYRFHGSETERMVKTILNVMAKLYLDSTLRSQLYFSLNKLVILEHDQAGLKIETDSARTLDTFCQWQTTWNPSSDSNPEHADYVVLLTKVDLELRGNAATAGLARKGMCGEKTRCAVVEDSGLAGALVMAHETGHVLGMNHDGDGNSCPDGEHIMATWAASGVGAFTWSACSARALKDFLDSSESSCLNDVPPPGSTDISASSTFPGTIYSASQQCRLMLGQEADVCEDVVVPGQTDVCGALVCRERPNSGTNGCQIYPTPRMDGTECGHRQWCMGAVCVAMGAGSPGPVDGGWSVWEAEMGPCSRSCGGGVKFRRRYCNNPEPKYGGKTCTGSDISGGELCNVQECPGRSQIDFLSQQCAATNDRPVQGHNYRWVPNIGVEGDASCKINCQVEDTNIIMSRGINQDGSECFVRDAASTTQKCVQGKCAAFGCDGHMESGHVFDKCAVCKGRGDMCRKVTGTYNQGRKQELTTFATFPGNSTGITITQGNRYCWISVTVNGEQLFAMSSSRMSGNYVIGGVSLKYNKLPEKIEITGPTSAPVIAQVYRQYGQEYVGTAPEVTYEYHVPTGHRQTTVYMWKTRAGACSKTCGTGAQTPIITCESVATGTVDDYNCILAEKPSEVPKPCNTQACPPRWRGAEWGECTKSCGGGEKQRLVQCVEENNNVDRVVDNGRCVGQTKPGSTSTCNSHACSGVWKAGAWSQCSTSCARGTRARTVRCYSSATSNTPIDDSSCILIEKPTEQEACIAHACETKSGCSDEVDNCDQYAAGFCTGPSYSNWAKKNCAKYCGYCEEITASGSCSDAVNDCAAYGSSMCTEYASWAKQKCQRFCHFCDTDNHNGACKDASNECASYVSSMCTEYKSWAVQNCQAYCGFCGHRKKRDLRDLLVPIVEPSKAYDSGIVPPKKAINEENMSDIVPGIDVTVNVPDVIGNSDDVIMFPRKRTDEAPPTALCNTVRTTSRGAIDVRGKLVEGEVCEQILVVSAENRILLTFEDLRMDCQSGDEMTIVDGVTNEKRSLCDSQIEKTWLSHGNIVVLQFKAGVNGHGHSFSYEAIPQQKQPACRQQFTDVAGHLTVQSSDVTECEIYVIVTPGRSVQIIFNEFHMVDMTGKPGCIKVEDMEG